MDSWFVLTAIVYSLIETAAKPGPGTAIPAVFQETIISFQGQFSVISAFSIANSKGGNTPGTANTADVSGESTTRTFPMKCIMLSTKFIVFSTKSIIVSTHFVMFSYTIHHLQYKTAPSPQPHLQSSAFHLKDGGRAQRSMPPRETACGTDYPTNMRQNRPNSGHK